MDTSAIKEDLLRFTIGKVEETEQVSIDDSNLKEISHQLSLIINQLQGELGLNSEIDSAVEEHDKTENKEERESTEIVKEATEDDIL